MDVNLFKEICEKQCGLRPDEPVLSAFSGGADSLSLLIMLREAGYRVTAAHFNHHLRVAASADAVAAEISARKLGITFISGEADVAAVVRSQKISVEEAARQCRYAWLFEQARLINAQAIVVGHTADDQVETVLMHLLRGAGLDGLRGMSFRQVFPLWDEHIPVVRPLLQTWREETEMICQQTGITPVQDESNLSTQYYRNRIRLELLPYLQDFNPQVKTHILQTSRILAEEDNILRDVKDQAWQACFARRANRYIALHLNVLREQPVGLQRTVLRRAMWELDPLRRDIDYEATLSLVEFVLSPSRSGLMQLPGKIWAQVNGDALILWQGKPGLLEFFPQIDADKEYRLDINGKLEFPGWSVEAAEDDLISARDAFKNGGFPYKVWLDADRILNPLTLRAYQSGERFFPLRMDGKSQKVSDFWVNRKVPRQARKNWPLICSGQSIVWIPGYAVSEIAAVTNLTRRVVRLCLQFQDRPPDDRV